MVSGSALPVAGVLAMHSHVRLLLVGVLLFSCAPIGSAAPDEAGFVSLFDGKDLAGWKVPAGDNGHWKVVDGAIDYDARSESKGTDKCLWSDKSYRDFVLRLEWRLKTDPGFEHPIPVILPDGTHKKDANGKELEQVIEDVDSGVYVRGSSKSQVNIWMWPIGSGEVYGYRMDRRMPASVRAGVTPKKHADKPRGEWNTFEITVKGDRRTVVLNGEEVISKAELPGVPAQGPIALQHHGEFDAKTGKWKAPPSLVQFRNIRIKELN
jgi:3-keto-disaccharide hydrolase